MEFSKKQLETINGGNQKHFIIYYQIGTGTYVVTSPRAWARENNHLFPGVVFTGTNPTTNQIVKLLTEKYGFETKNYQEPKVSVTYNMAPLFKFKSN